jgi:iron-sulfur cluster assembly protein
MVTLTESAKDVVREMTQDGGDDSGVRIAAEQDAEGVQGLSLSVVPAPADGDTVVDEAGSRVFLEPVAAEMLEGKVIDAQRHDDHVHFSVAEQG